MYQKIFALSIFTVLSFGFPVIAYAGGGSIQPVNFSEGQQIQGKSFSPVVVIKDPSSGYSSPWANQEYTVQAHGDLAGASCNTTQRVSDSQGQIKADCKADAYGTFQFEINAADGSNHSTWTVLFADSASGSGYIEQPPAGDFTVHIVNGNLTVTPNQVFSLTADMKQNGSTISNYDAVDYIRWEVLQGSMSIVATSDHLDRTPQIKISDLGKTVIRATAVMKDNRTFQSGAVTVTVAYPTPKATPTSTPTSNNGNTNNSGSNSGSSSDSNSNKTTSPSSSPKVTPRASAAAEMTATPSATETPQPEVVQEPVVKPHFNFLTTFQNLGKKIGSLFSHLWKK